MHEALAPQCAFAGCTCLRYTPVTAGTVNGAPSAPTGPTAGELIAAGKRSGSKRTVALAEKIHGLVLDLRGRLAEDRLRSEAKLAKEREKDGVRREVADLEVKLAAARAKLHGRTVPDDAPSPRAASPCSRPGCDRTFASGQARAMHERRAHDGFDPRAATAG
jgi:hypothetical protein